MERIIIGLTGSLCSGKGTIATHLKELGFRHFVLGDRVRDEVRSRHQDVTRTLLQDVGNELRDTYGGAVLAERTVKLLDDVEGNIVIDGLRNPEEIKYLRDVLGAKIVGVDAPKDLRLKWYLERAKQRGEDGPSPEDFKKDDDRDFGIGEPGNGQHVEKCLSLADVVLWNTGPKDILFSQCDSFLVDTFHFNPEIHQS